MHPCHAFFAWNLSFKLKHLTMDRKLSFRTTGATSHEPQQTHAKAHLPVHPHDIRSATMRISTHGNDLLITDQSLGLGAALVSGGALLLVSSLDQLLSGGTLIQALITGALGCLGILLGLRRLSASQLIVDPDEQAVVTKQWSFVGTQVQRYRFHDVQGFEILPEGKDKGTQLMIRTSSGLVPAVGRVKAMRAAWQEVIGAIQAHMKS